MNLNVEDLKNRVQKVKDTINKIKEEIKNDKIENINSNLFELGEHLTNEINAIDNEIQEEVKKHSVFESEVQDQIADLKIELKLTEILREIEELKSQHVSYMNGVREYVQKAISKSEEEYENYKKNNNFDTTRETRNYLMNDVEIVEFYNRIKHYTTEKDKLEEANPTEEQNEIGKQNQDEDAKLDKFQKEVNEFAQKLEGYHAICYSTEVEPLDIEKFNGRVEKIQELQTKYKELNAQKKELKEDMQNSPTFNTKELESTFDKLSFNLRETIQRTVDDYNLVVDNIKNRIESLKANSELSDELKSQIPEEIKKIDYKKIQVTFTKYKQINYDLLKVTTDKLNEIETNLTKGPESPTVDEDNIEEKYNYIILLLDKLDQDITKAEKEDIPRLKLNLGNIKDEYEKIKDRLTDEQKAKIDKRIESCTNNIASIEGQEKESENNDNNQEYNKLLVEIDVESRLLDEKIAYFKEYEKGITDERLQELINKAIEQSNNNINNIKEMLNSNENKLTPKQIEEAKKKIAELEGKVAKLDKIKSVVKTNLESIKGHIEDLSDIVNNPGDKKFNKEERKKIDDYIKTIEDEIRYYEQKLDVEEKNSPKYKENKKALEELKIRLELIEKDYRKKCPLFVRVVKSAQKFYKKHKKLCLITAGLAAIALQHFVIGPVIAPAIMQGNLMLMNKIPALKAFLGAQNNVLGVLAKAKEVVSESGRKYWYLANGNMINPACTSISLVKGVALTQIPRLAPLAIPGLVLAIKKLAKKMKKEEQTEEKNENEELTEENAENEKKEKERKISKLVKKGQNIIDNGRNKIVEKKNSKELTNLFLEYRNYLRNNKESGKSLEELFDEFANEKELSVEQRKALLNEVKLFTQDNVRTVQPTDESTEEKGRGR